MNDPIFHELVNAIGRMISVNGFSPSELREACFLAHYRYEMENPQAINARFMAAMDEIYRLGGCHDPTRTKEE